MKQLLTWHRFNIRQQARNTVTDIQDKMNRELASRQIFETASSYAYKYIQTRHTREVYPGSNALAGLSHFVEELPEEPTPGIEVVRQLHSYGSPATVIHSGGRYFGFVNGSAIPAAQACRWLADIWDQNAAMYVTSPIAAQLESVVETWLKELLDLPDTTAMGLVSGTSVATMVGLITARNKLLERLGWNINDNGLFDAPKIRVIISEQAHGSVFKALSLIGLGKKRVETVPADTQGRIRVDKLPELDNHCIVILQAGNVNTGSFDDFDTICRRAKKAGAWVHVDGAFGLWAAASSAYKHLVKGVELADSWSVDGHKTLNTPYDCGIIFCKDRHALASAMQASGSYLQFSEERDNMHFVPEMSRRSKGVDIWATMKFLGKQGIEELVDQMCHQASSCGKQLHDAGFTLLNDVVFNQVLMRGNSDEETQFIVGHLRDSGKVWLGTTNWQERLAIRISVCSWMTTGDDIAILVEGFQLARQAYNTSV